ncbi:MAG: hypothetical protein ACFHWX_05480 [Bacteroidota bacterium]
MRYLTVLFVSIIWSCGGSPQNHTESTDQQASSISSGSSSSSCLAEITDPEQWYSKTELAQLVGESEEIINFKSNPQYDNCNFSWKNDRKSMMKMGNIEMEIPSNNTVGITITKLDDKIERAEKTHKRSFTYEEYFDMYHTTTKKGEEQVKEALDEKAKEDESAKTAKSLLDMAPTEGHTDVTGLGDKANMYIQTAPGLRETRLSILHGNVVIMVNADVSADDATDRETAEAVAKSVLALCD